MFKYNTWKQRLGQIASSYQRFPLTNGLAIGLWLFLIVNEYRMDQILGQVWLGQLLLTWIYAISLSFAIESLCESQAWTSPQRLIAYGLGAIIVGLLYFQVFHDPERIFSADAGYIYAGLMLATWISILLERGLWPQQRIPYKMLEVLVTFGWTVLFSFVIGVGSQLIFVMIDVLFKLGLRLDRTARVIFESTSLLFSIPFFLSGLKPSGQTVVSDYSGLFRKLLHWVCLPLAAIYTAILYVYSAKILITQTWPQGIVSHLVLWYSLFVILVYIFLRGDRQKLPRFWDVFPWIVLPLLAMMFGSIGQRILQYGWTPNRYYVVLAGIWAMLALIYLGLKKAYRPVVLVALLIGFILIGTNSPLGAYDVSVRSQQMIIEKVLIDQGMLESGKLVAQVPAPADRERITALLQWFERMQAKDRLSFLPVNFQWEDFAAVFGFEPEYYGGSSDVEFLSYYADQEFELVIPKGRLIQAELTPQRAFIGDDIELRLDGDHVVLTRAGQSQELRLDFLDWLWDSPEQKERSLLKVELTGYQLYVREILLERRGDQDQIQQLTLILFIPE